ncbi:MAG TPA: hypothetical protein VN641_06795 [Urbifossiella sp.]|nr:hypothetical protein [Urbifossiella sp.]
MIPVVKALYLCDDVLADPTRTKPHLIGVMNAIRPPSYPYRIKKLCVFAQLIGGQGDVACVVRIVNSANRGLVYESEPFRLRFEERRQTRYFVLRITDIAIQAAGEYWVELTCDGSFVDDAVLRILDEAN